MYSKDELLAEAAFILEQEGWLIGRAAHEIGSRRLAAFEKRYQEWREKVKEFRKLNPDWKEPPDNS